MRLHQLMRALIYGLLVTVGLIGLITLVWAAQPRGSSVIYTDPDTVTMPAGTTFTGQTMGALGPFTAAGSFTASAALMLSGALSPAQLTANQNDYNPANLATTSLLRLSTDASRDLTGLAGGTSGRVLTLHNVGSQNLAIRAESTASSAANRFAMPSDLILPPNGMIVVQYDGTSTRWRTIAPQLTGGTLTGTLLTLVQQASDVNPPTAGGIAIYAKTGSSDVYTRDSSGNIKNFFSAGSGGTGVGLTARLITTTNMDLTGEETIEGILTSGSRVFVAGQSTGTQNGLYVTGSGSWTRATDAATGASFTAGTLVTITDGIAGASGNKGTTWMYTTSGTYNTSTLTAVKTAYGPSAAAFELAANKNAASGYAGLTSAIKQVWTQRGDAATHTASAAAGQITPTASTMRVSGSGGPVTLTTGKPRILGCTTSADDGKELTVEGSDATNTLTMPTGNGVKLCGNTGSLVLGLNLASAHFVCNGATAIWRQSNCPTLQTVANVGRTIIADETNPVIIANTAGSGRFERYVDSSTGKPTDRAICAGVACATTELTNPQFVASGSKPTCDATTRGLRWDTLGGAGVADILEVCQKSSADTYAWLAPGTKTTTITVPVDTINFADANASIQPSDRTQYDSMVTQFEDAVTGCVFYRAYIPSNLASSPNWNAKIVHSAISGAGGTVILSLDAKLYATNVAKDASFTSLTLPSSGAVTVNTSENLTITTLGATNFDGLVALSPDQLLRLKLCRLGGSGSDSLGVAWLLENLVLRVDVQ